MRARYRGARGAGLCDTARRHRGADGTDVKLLLSSLARAARLWFGALASPVTERRSPLRAATLVLVWPLFCVLQLVHWIGFGLDEIFFRGWRRVPVREPLFVLGPPRSGTTHLHRVLSADPQTTTFRTWECLFGLSVTARKLLLGLGRLDRALGRPLGRAGSWLGTRFLAGMDDVHPFALDAPEEDFLALMPAMQCFVLVVAFPRAGWLWRTARLDQSPDRAERTRLMAFYKTCVQKHLYAHGPDKRFLSKNASFSGMAESLLETFPEARIMATMRDPRYTVPSTLSAIGPGLAAAGFSTVPGELRDRMVALLKFYYLNLERVAADWPDRVAVIDNQALHEDLARSVTGAYRALGLEPDGRFVESLAAADRRSRGFRSAHAYTLAEFGLTETMIEQVFAEVYRARDFPDTPGPAVHAADG